MDQNATKLQAGAMSGVGLWRLAWRNLTRNRRRSLITISAISLGLALMIFSFNIGNSMYQKMIQQGISTMAGHVVVQGAGFQEERETDVVVSDPEGAKSALQSASPDGVVTSRSFVQGLLTSPDNAVGVMLTAVEPSLEAQVSSWDE